MLPNIFCTAEVRFLKVLLALGSPFRLKLALEICKHIFEAQAELVVAPQETAEIVVSIGH